MGKDDEEEYWLFRRVSDVNWIELCKFVAINDDDYPEYECEQVAAGNREPNDDECEIYRADTCLNKEIVYKKTTRISLVDKPPSNWGPTLIAAGVCAAIAVLCGVAA